MERTTPIPTFRIIFFGIIVAFIVQMILISRVGELYPAVMMPPFRGSGGHQNGQVEIARYEATFVTPQKEFIVSPRRLLDQFPDSHHFTINETFLSPITEASQSSAKESVNFLSPIKKMVFPGYLSGSKNRNSPENIESFRNWLRNRAETLFPGENVIRVEIRWYRDICRLQEGELVVLREPSSTLTIPLEGEIE